MIYQCLRQAAGRPENGAVETLCLFRRENSTPMDPMMQSGKARRAGPVQLEPGDIAPRLRLPDENGRPVDLLDNDIAGKPTIVAFCPDIAGPQTAQTLACLAGIEQEVTGLGGQIVVISGQPVEVNARAAAGMGPGVRVLVDPGGSSFADYGIIASEGPAVFLLDANQHLLAAACPAGPDLGETLLEHVRSEAEGRRARLMERHPPVLVQPGVLSPDDCRRLITLFNMEGNVWVEPGHGDKGMTSDYKMRVPEYGRGDRVDHWVVNAATRDFISSRLQRRLFPEIQKSFQYRITKAETYRIGCYEGQRGGDLHGHRDNTAPLVAHRRFAASINLNTEEYEGGELRFPEFGDQRYRPATGAAIAFSCSLLHEALHVTSGRRYVLMAFFFGEH